MHRVCCFRWCRHVISWTVDVWLELVSLVSCILPPLPQFHAVTFYRPLCLQTRHTWRWLTSVKLWIQSRCSLVSQTFLTNHDLLYTSVTEIAWNMQISTNDNSIKARFAGIRSRRDFHTFCYTDGLFTKKVWLSICFSAEIFFPSFSIFISARILVSATNSRLWTKNEGEGHS